VAMCSLDLFFQAAAFFQNGRVANPGHLIGLIVDIALVVWLCRGSNVAAYILSALLIIGFVLWGLLIFAGVSESDAVMLGVGALGFIVSGYCWWAVTFSREVRTELARRREAHLTGDREKRRAFYQEMGEKMPD
jgi:hypothetical protein